MNRELYKKCFSKLHTLSDLEVDNMKNVSVKMMGKKMATICAIAVGCAFITAGGTYAVTGGETANPFEAFEIFINGEDAKDRLVQGEDGKYSIKLGADEEFTFQNETVKTKIVVPENPAKSDITIKINPNEAEQINVEVGE